MELGSEPAASVASAQDRKDTGILDSSLVNASSGSLSPGISVERDEAIPAEPLFVDESSAELASEGVRDVSSADAAQTPLPDGGVEGEGNPEEHQRCDHGIVDLPEMPDSVDSIRERKNDMQEGEQQMPNSYGHSVPELAEKPENSAANRNVPERTPSSLRRRNFYVIKVPRPADNELRSKIRHAELQVDEASKSRDVIRAALQLRRACKTGLLDKLKVVRDIERGCRDEFQKKRLEIDPLQTILNKLKFPDTKFKDDDIFSEEDLDNKIASLQHRIQHESITLKEEKQLVREINQLESQRSQVCANDAEHANLLESYGSIEDMQNQIDLLYSDLAVLRANQNNARLDCKPIEKDLEVLNVKIDELVDQLEAAKRSYASALATCKELKRNLNEQNTEFYKYRDNYRKAKEMAATKNLEGLAVHCKEQVESLLSSWNANLDFREQYIKNNMQSTLKRLETLDGRSLGLDEEPLLFVHDAEVVPEMKPKDVESVTKRRRLETSDGRSSGLGEEPLLLVNDAEKVPEIQPKDVESVTKRTGPRKEMGAGNSPSSVQRNNIRGSQGETARQQRQEIQQEAARNVSKKKEVVQGKTSGEKKSSQMSSSSMPASSSGSAVPQSTVAAQPPVPAPPSLEDAAVKEVHAAKLKEKQRQEQIAKARDAAERKRRQTERAQAKAQLRAQKEAERREKERAKKAKKKLSFSVEDAKTLQCPGIATVEDKEERFDTEEVAEASATRSLSRRKDVLQKQFRHSKQQNSVLYFVENIWQNHFTWLLALFITIAIGGVALFSVGKFQS